MSIEGCECLDANIHTALHPAHYIFYIAKDLGTVQLYRYLVLESNDSSIGRRSRYSKEQCDIVGSKLSIVKPGRAHTFVMMDL